MEYNLTRLVWDAKWPSALWARGNGKLDPGPGSTCDAKMPRALDHTFEMVWDDNMLKLNSWKSDLKTRCFMMFLFSIVFVCLRYIQSKHIQAIQYTSIHINTLRCWLKKIENIRRVPRFFGSPLWPLRPFHRCPPGAARGPPRRQRHRPGGRPGFARRGAAPAADGARRGGRDGRLRPHRAALRGVPRPRRDLPGAAGGWARCGRQWRRRPLGPEEMDARCFGEISGCKKKNRNQNVKWCEMMWNVNGRVGLVGFLGL